MTEQTQPTDAPLNPIDLMKVVMQADEETRAFALRGTTNWAAHIGKAVQNAVLAKWGTPAGAGPIADNPKPGDKYWDISGGLAREQIWQGLSPEWDLLDAGLLFWNEADSVAALSIPASTVVSEPEDVQRARIIAAIAQRWIGDRTHLGALVYLDDLAWALKTLAATPTPQPTQAQAGAVPLKYARLHAISLDYSDSEDECTGFRDGWRAAEKHHGIKGADHA